MHCLGVIVARNERAAAREEAHAINDGDNRLADAICEANSVGASALHTPTYKAAYKAAYRAGLKEG